MDQSFGKVLESHRDWPAPTSMATIRDPTFTVQRSSLDAPFFAEMASILSCEPVGEQVYKDELLLYGGIALCYDTCVYAKCSDVVDEYAVHHLGAG